MKEYVALYAISLFVIGLKKPLVSVAISSIVLAIALFYRYYDVEAFKTVDAKGKPVDVKGKMADVVPISIRELKEVAPADKITYQTTRANETVAPNHNIETIKLVLSTGKQIVAHVAQASLDMATAGNASLWVTPGELNKASRDAINAKPHDNGDTFGYATIKWG